MDEAYTDSGTNHHDCRHPASSSHSQKFSQDLMSTSGRQQQQQQGRTGRLQGLPSAAAAAASFVSSGMTFEDGSSYGAAASSQHQTVAWHSAQRHFEGVLASSAVEPEALFSSLLYSHQDLHRDFSLEPISLDLENDLDDLNLDQTSSPQTSDPLPENQTVYNCDFVVQDLCHVSKDGNNSGSSKRRKSGDSSGSSNLQLTAQLQLTDTAAAAAAGTGKGDVWCNARTEMICMTALHPQTGVQDQGAAAAAAAAAANAIAGSSALGRVLSSEEQANTATPCASSHQQQQQQLSSSNGPECACWSRCNLAAAAATAPAAGKVASPTASACFMVSRREALMASPTQQAAAATLPRGTASKTWQQQQQQQQQQQAARTAFPSAATVMHCQAAAGVHSPLRLQQIPGNAQPSAISSDTLCMGGGGSGRSSPQQQQRAALASTLKPPLGDLPTGSVMLSAPMPLLPQQQQQLVQCSTPMLISGSFPVVSAQQQQQQQPVKLFGPFTLAGLDMSNTHRSGLMASTLFSSPNGQLPLQTQQQQQQQLLSPQAADLDQPGTLLQAAVAAAGSSAFTVPAGTTVRLSDVVSPEICANAHLALQQRLQAAYQAGYADAVEYCQQQYKRQQQRAAQQQQQKQQADAAAGLPKGGKRRRLDSSPAVISNPNICDTLAVSPVASPEAAVAAAEAWGRPEPDYQVLGPAAAAAGDLSPAMAALLQVNREEAAARLRSMSDKDLLLLAAQAVQQKLPVPTGLA